jgi:hypothetical protein
MPPLWQYFSRPPKTRSGLGVLRERLRQLETEALKRLAHVRETEWGSSEQRLALPQEGVRPKAST